MPTVNGTGCSPRPLGRERSSAQSAGPRRCAAAVVQRRVVVAGVEDFESVTGPGVRELAGGPRGAGRQPGFLIAAGVDLAALTARIDQ